MTSNGTDVSGPTQTVGIAELAVAASKTGSLITHALGSCIGVTLFGPVAAV
ncbi:MAG: hypothetical protein KDB61_14445 [Planctomycetes bacterium]|nr:hypothetical protein [Planctomycetota bacterium]